MICGVCREVLGQSYRFGSRAATPFESLAVRIVNDSAAHRLGIKAEILSESLFAEGFTATDDAGGGVRLELVVFVLEEVLNARADVGFVDGKDDGLVTGEEL